jgi:hypothetical protein
MYTNIKTEPALEEMTAYLRANKKEFSYPCEALIEALQIVFRNNYFKFGDTYHKQISGTAMGTPPAPPWATCTFGNYERKLIPKWELIIPFYRRFIDDIIGMWICDHDSDRNSELFEQYKQDLNGWNGLNWKCSNLSTSVNFMDLTITIVNGKLHTTIYEKEQNLYLYIPPHSSHPKGVLSGLIFGQILHLDTSALLPPTLIRKFMSTTNDSGIAATRMNHSSHSSVELKTMQQRTSVEAQMRRRGCVS